MAERLHVSRETNIVPLEIPRCHYLIGRIKQKEVSLYDSGIFYGNVFKCEDIFSVFLF